MKTLKKYPKITELPNHTKLILVKAVHRCIKTLKFIKLFQITESFFVFLQTSKKKMNKVRITAIRQTVYKDLMAKFENPIEHTCDVVEGQQWISVDGKCPEGMCPSAWSSMREFVESLAKGEGNFYDGWMKNPMSAMISCNDGFRPFSFYIEVIDASIVTLK